jgi:hypothetical protein
VPDAQKVIKDHGGVYPAGGFNKTVALTGAAPPNRVVIFKFEGADGAKKWWEGSVLMTSSSSRRTTPRCQRSAAGSRGLGWEP